MAWGRRLAPALAACALSGDALGADFDARAVYYAMLKAVESSFSAHSEMLENAYRASRSALSLRDGDELRRLRREREEIERAQRDREAVFEAEREALNARVASINEAARQLEADRQAAGGVAAYREALARALAEVGAAQARYRELGAQVQARRGALEAAARAYRSGTTEGAKEIARLNDAYRRFAAEAGEAAREREAAYRRAREELESWRGERIERLRRAEQALARRAGEYAARKGEHDRALRELNRRIDTYNERVHAGDGGEAREPALLALAGEITAQEEVLAALREQALALAGVIEDRRGVLAREREALVRERGERERGLAGLAEAVLSAQQDAAARITARRAEVQAQIEDVEAGFRAELRSLSAGLSAAERRIESEFGSAPEALLTAVAEWTGSRDPPLLYHAGGAERFERSPPRSAALYDAVDAVRSARRRVDDEAPSALPAFGERRAAVRAERAATAAQRQSLVRRQRAFAARYAERWSEWQARHDAAERDLRRIERALAAYHEERLALAGLDLLALQGALLDLVGTAPPSPPEPGERARLHASVSEKGARLQELIAAPPATAHPLVEGFAAVGRGRDPGAPDMQWQPLASEPFTNARSVEGEDKRFLLAAWYRRLSARGTFDPLAQRLSQRFPAYSAADVEHSLYGLFETGMSEVCDIVRYRWSGRKVGYRVRILGRHYRLDPDGSLVPAPPVRPSSADAAGSASLEGGGPDAADRQGKRRDVMLEREPARRWSRRGETAADPARAAGAATAVA